MSPNERPRRGKKTKVVDQGKSKDFIAVRWPSTLRKQLKIAAAANDPPLTMTQYLAECFNKIQDDGGLAKASVTNPIVRHTDKEQRKRYQEAGAKLFATRDRRLIDSVILLLEYATR